MAVDFNLPTRSTGHLVTAADWNDLVTTLNFHSNPPAARVTHSANQSIAHNTLTTLSFNTTSLDTDNMHDSVTNNSRLTIQTAGLYVVTGAVIWETNTTGERSMRLRLNGTTIQGSAGGAPNPSAGLTTVLQASTLPTKFAVGDYVELLVRQLSGAPLNALSLAGFGPFLAAVRLGTGD